jgi:hypothetical protein
MDLAAKRSRGRTASAEKFVRLISAVDRRLPVGQVLDVASLVFATFG